MIKHIIVSLTSPLLRTINAPFSMTKIEKNYEKEEYELMVKGKCFRF